MEAIKELGLYIAELRHKDHVWGQTDCNTIVTNWIDKRHGLNTSDEIVGKYSTALEAARFAKNYKQAPDYLRSVGYDITNDNPRSGDVMLQRQEKYYCAYLVLTGRAYTVQATNGLIAVDARNLDRSTVWRYYG